MRLLLPPILVFMLAAVMSLCRNLLPLPVPWAQPLAWAGCLPALAGLALLVAARIHFAHRKTNIMTFGEPGRLVTDGPYRWTRNPMYLGFVLVLLAWAMVLGSLASLLVVPLFAVVTDRWYIAYEERAMLEKFGDAYRAYASSTRRWL